MRLPCANDGVVGSCPVTGDQVATMTIGGPPGIVYDVVLRVRGVVETQDYQGGCQLDAQPTSWVAGGTPSANTRNVFRLSISSPAQTYYLNGGSSTALQTVGVDLQKSVRVAAAGTITLSAQSLEGSQLVNVGANGEPVTIAGTMIGQPFSGQFAQIDVGPVQAETLPVRAADSAGSALSFMGGQMATALDVPSLRPTNMTLEAWFQFDGFGYDHESVLGKPFGDDTEDSYTIWYQTALNSGVAVHGPPDATSLTWYPSYGDWHHTAMTYDTATRVTIFYFDGAPSACLANSGPPVYDGHALYIGADEDADIPNGFWVGALDEVRIFSTVRTPDEVWTDMHTDKLGPVPGLAGEWTFDEGIGQTTVDSSGNGNTATLGQTAAPDTADPSWISSTVPR